MEFWALAIGIFALWGGVSLGRAWHVNRRRRMVLSQPFPSSWEAILTSRVALYRRLPSELRTRLKDRMLLFIDEKFFEGCGGLTVTDEMKVTVAALACLLILNRPGSSLYPGLSSILLYPDVYMAPEVIPLDDILAVESVGVQSGESWREGMIVLAWRDVKSEANDLDSGYNVVLHEFAHQLDEEKGWADGTPLLSDRNQYESWRSVFHREFSRFREDSAYRRTSPLDEYGALDPAEFFAVATETFFQMPRPMRRAAPDLYEQLRRCYGVDPAQWEPEEAPR